MSGSLTLYSALWHRVENLRPKMKPGVRVERHVIRGEIWYVTRDRLSAASHRLSAPVYAILMRMDGERTVTRIWQEVVELFGADAPSQDQVIQMLGQLSTFDLVQADTLADGRELAQRAEQMRGKRWLQQIQNPLFFKLPLFDPHRFLTVTAHLVRPFFSPLGLLLWLAIVGWFVMQGVTHWQELSGNFSDRLLAPDNLVILFVLFPAIKLVHELGHAYSTRIFGGEVHEVGLMFLVFMPAPYVDATASAAFDDKWRRIVVAASGMMAELVLAAAAMAVWINAEPGVLRSAAFNTMMIASVSTLVFNSNPLLRFDAYYIFADLVEIPNLASRAAKWWYWLAQRYLFGMREAVNPITARGESFWFAVYAPASLLYRLTVVFSIALVVGSSYFFVGVALVGWTLAQSFLWPLLKAMQFVLVSPAVGRRRLRAAVVTLGGVLAAVGLAGYLPLPHGTVAQGVLWVPDEARLTAATLGTVKRFLVEPGTLVDAGTPIVELEDPYILNERRLAVARLEELRYRLQAAESLAPATIAVIRKQMEFAETELVDTEKRMAALTLTAPLSGRAILPRWQDLVGSHAARGTVLGYVMPDSRPIVRAVVPESVIDLVRNETRDVAVRLSGRLLEPVEKAHIARLVPGAERRLPSLALAANAGGPFVLDPAAQTKDVALQAFFVADIALPDDFRPQGWGERVYVRFDHGTASLFEQVYRSFRQMFLKRFNV